MGKLSDKEDYITQYEDIRNIKKRQKIIHSDNDRLKIEITTIKKRQQKEKRAQEKRSSLEKVKHMKAKIKGDANKERIIDDIFTMAQTSEHIFNAQEMTATKMSFQDKDGNFYTVQITKHKSRPDGYVADLEKGQVE